MAAYLADIAGRMLPYPQMHAPTDPPRAAGDAAAASFHLYGEAAALVREEPAAELVRRPAAEAWERIAALPRGPGPAQPPAPSRGLPAAAAAGAGGEAPGRARGGSSRSGPEAT
jgi:hypothetical protein